MDDGMKPFDLDAWAEMERERIDRFVAMWKANFSRDPNIWPMKMPLGEWDEQFRAFESGEP